MSSATMQSLTFITFMVSKKIATFKFLPRSTPHWSTGPTLIIPCFHVRLKAVKKETNKQTNKPGNTKELQWQQKSSYNKNEDFDWHAVTTQWNTSARLAKSITNCYIMHGPDGPREEVVTQCMVQVVRGKKSLHNALFRWSAGRSCTQCMVQLVRGKSGSSWWLWLGAWVHLCTVSVAACTDTQSLWPSHPRTVFPSLLSQLYTHKYSLWRTCM